LEALRSAKSSFKEAVLKGDPKLRPGDNVIDGFIKPITKNKETCYAQILFDNHSTEHLVGDCTTYLSHPWSVDFEWTLEAVEEYERTLPEDAPTQFYFCDFFAINQHNLEKDLRQLGFVVQSCNTLLLMAKPWQNPVIIDRLWCVYEVSQALRSKTELVFILPPNQWEEFHEALLKCMSDVWTFMREVFLSVSSCKAITTHPGDAQRINEFILKYLGGFQQVDQIVSQGLLSWLRRYIRAMVEDFPANGTIQHASFAYDAGDFFFDLEQFQTSYLSYEQSAALYKRLGDRFNWLTARNGMMIAMSNMGRKKESLTLSIELVQECVQEFGPHHEKTLDMKDNLATEYTESGLLHKAEPILREVLDGYQKIKRPMSKDIRITMMTLARILMQTNQVDEAANILEKMIVYETKNFGRDDESTLCSVSLFGRCQALKGMHSTAIELYQEALPVMIDKWGIDDMHVKNCEVWLEEAKEAVRQDDA